MSVTLKSEKQLYDLCSQAPGYEAAYGNYSAPNCFQGDSYTFQGNIVTCAYRDPELHYFLNPNPQSSNCDGHIAESEINGLAKPFASYGVNYWGNLNPFRDNATATYGGIAKSQYMKDQGFKNPVTEPEMFIPEKPLKFIKTLETISYPGSTIPGQSQCSSAL